MADQAEIESLAAKVTEFTRANEPARHMQALNWLAILQGIATQAPAVISLIEQILNKVPPAAAPAAAHKK